jgi:2-polyprenyl-3-methyl-5-hydroxy-6-metoxy-1,4-benzoquinol methylase
MNESISRLGAAAPDLDLTGERIVPGKTPEVVFREHEERYAFAAQYVLGKHVLDVACGTGVGTFFLRQAGARCAWGLDIDPRAIAFAKSRYGDCKFAQSDATALCLQDNSVDVVVSFETVEHLGESAQRKFPLECRRVLRPGGLLICSTPNTTLYRWCGVNAYHVREYTIREFASLLGAHFVGSAMFYQQVQVYPLVVLRRVISRSLGSLGLKRPLKAILGMQGPPSTMRQEFLPGNGNTIREIPRYKTTRLKQPKFVIVVCRKNLKE